MILVLKFFETNVMFYRCIISMRLGVYFYAQYITIDVPRSQKKGSPS